VVGDAHSRIGTLRLGVTRRGNGSGLIEDDRGVIEEDRWWKSLLGSAAAGLVVELRIKLGELIRCGVEKVWAGLEFYFNVIKCSDWGVDRESWGRRTAEKVVG